MEQRYSSACLKVQHQHDEGGKQNLQRWFSVTDLEGNGHWLLLMNQSLPQVTETDLHCNSVSDSGGE